MSSLGTVLIVDNDEFTLIELERVLEDAGFETTTTWDVSEAVRLLNANTYDYILLGECFSGGIAGQHLQCASLGALLQRCVILSPRSIVLGADLPASHPITVCKRRVEDVLRAVSGKRSCPLAHAA